jgi:hypothetical protein
MLRLHARSLSPCCANHRTLAARCSKRRPGAEYSSTDFVLINRKVVWWTQPALTCADVVARVLTRPIELPRYSAFVLASQL